MCVQNLKFVPLPVPEIIGGSHKIWTIPAYANAPFSPKILMGFCSDGHCEYTCQISNLKYVSLPVPEIIVIGVLGGVAAPSLRAEKVVGDRGWNRSKER